VQRAEISSSSVRMSMMPEACCSTDRTQVRTVAYLMCQRRWMAGSEVPRSNKSLRGSRGRIRLKRVRRPTSVRRLSVTQNLVPRRRSAGSAVTVWSRASSSGLQPVHARGRLRRGLGLRRVSWRSRWGDRSAIADEDRQIWWGLSGRRQIRAYGRAIAGFWEPQGSGEAGERTGKKRLAVRGARRWGTWSDLRSPATIHPAAAEYGRGASGRSRFRRFRFGPREDWRRGPRIRCFGTANGLS